MAKEKRNDAQRHLKNVLNQKRLQYDSVMRSLPRYTVAGLLLFLLALALFLVPWAEIYNTDIAGVEVTTHGFSFLAAAITRSFTSTAAIYKDLAVPFYYYAQSWCISIAWATLAAFLGLLVGLIAQVLTVTIKAYACSLICAIGGILGSIGLLIAFILGRSMSTSDILPIYCSGNPACSIHSYAFVPAIPLLIAGVLGLIAYVSYAKAAKDLEKAKQDVEKAGPLA